MKVSETTIIKVLVNLKCLGYMGRCVRSLSPKEKGEIIETLYKRGWVDESATPTLEAMPIIMKNLHLCEK